MKKDMRHLSKFLLLNKVLVKIHPLVKPHYQSIRHQGRLVELPNVLDRAH